MRKLIKSIDLFCLWIDLCFKMKKEINTLNKKGKIYPDELVKLFVFCACIVGKQRQDEFSKELKILGNKMDLNNYE